MKTGQHPLLPQRLSISAGLRDIVLARAVRTNTFILHPRDTLYYEHHGLAPETDVDYERRGILFFFSYFFRRRPVGFLALYGRQPLLVAYIALGALLGPYGMAAVPDVKLISDISHIGIIFLLFLLGLDMQPQSLLRVFKKVTLVTLVSSLIFAAAGYTIARLFALVCSKVLSSVPR